jgi:hypothetical protein
METNEVNVNSFHCNVFVIGISSSSYVCHPLVGLPVNKEWGIILKAEFLICMTSNGICI